MRKVKQRGGKYTMTSTDTSNGNLRIMGMSGGSLYSTIRRNKGTPPFVTPQVKQVGGSLYRSRYGQFGGDTSMFGKIWRG